MSKTIVSILSEHLVPNLIFIREMEGTPTPTFFSSPRHLWSSAAAASTSR